MDKADFIDVAETVQGALADVILAEALAEDSLETELRLSRTDYPKYAMAVLRILNKEMGRIYGDLTAGINAEFERRKGKNHADK